MDISTHIAHRASWTPQKTAFRYEGQTLTYSELDRAVSGAAAWLRARGVARDDRVAFLGPNCPELLVLVYACARLGAIFVPLNARMPAAELQVFVEACRPSLLVAEESFQDVAIAVAPAAASVFHLGASDLRGDESIGRDPERYPGEPALIAFTSGTTGRPKGAAFSQQALNLGALRMIADEGLTEADEVLVVSPLFHVAALVSVALPGLCAGATLTIHRQFDAGRVLDDLQSYGITRFMCSPVMTKALAAHPAWAAAKLSSLRAVYTGSTFILEPDVAPWQAKGIPVVQGYGMTEAPGIALTPPDALPEQVLAGGRPTFLQQVRVVGSSGHDLPVGEPGEVWTRGPAMMLGYWENDEATRTAVQEGWFRTGDVGVFDEQGYLRVVDRLNDVIIVGTSNVYPADLEGVPATCPQIGEAAVIGRPDADLGEVPVAFVVPARGATLTTAQVVALFADRVASYKQPRQVVFLEALPRNALGKVQKAALRELLGLRPRPDVEPRFMGTRG